MKTNMNLLTAALLASIATLSVSAQVKDGSNSSRAPLPSQRPQEYVQVATDGISGNSSIVANHIGGPATTQQIAVVTPVQTTTTQVYAVVTPAPVPASAGATLDVTHVGPQLRSDATASQEQLSDLEARVKASGESMAATRSTQPAMSATNTAALKVANNDVKDTEAALRKSIKTARSTNSEQQQLASDYEAYAAAVARVAAANRIASNPID